MKGKEMSFDLEFLIDGMKKSSSMVIEKIRVEINSEYGGRARYKDTFRYMAEKEGAWCSLLEVEPENRFFSAMNIADIDEEVSDSNVCYPFWTDKVSGMCVLKIVDEYYPSFKTVMNKLKHYLLKSV